MHHQRERCGPRSSLSALTAAIIPTSPPYSASVSQTWRVAAVEIGRVGTAMQPALSARGDSGPDCNTPGRHQLVHGCCTHRRHLENGFSRNCFLLTFSYCHRLPQCCVRGLFQHTRSCASARSVMIFLGVSVSPCPERQNRCGHQHIPVSHSVLCWKHLFSHSVCHSNFTIGV